MCKQHAHLFFCFKYCRVTFSLLFAAIKSLQAHIPIHSLLHIFPHYSRVRITAGRGQCSRTAGQ